VLVPVSRPWIGRGTWPNKSAKCQTHEAKWRARRRARMLKKNFNKMKCVIFSHGKEIYGRDSIAHSRQEETSWYLM
jgi:hypothetical protein